GWRKNVQEKCTTNPTEKQPGSADFDDIFDAVQTLADDVTDLRREEAARARFANEQHVEHDRATIEELALLRAEVIVLKLLMSSVARHVGELIIASREQPRPEAKPATRRTRRQWRRL